MTPGLFPVFKALPFTLRVPLRIKLINDDFPTFGMPMTSAEESGSNWRWNLSVLEISSMVVGKTWKYVDENKTWFQISRKTETKNRICEQFMFFVVDDRFYFRIIKLWERQILIVIFQNTRL